MADPALILAVDLAAVYSAACLMTARGELTWQIDSWGVSEDTFISALVAPWSGSDILSPQAMIIEDLPHRLPFSGLVKRVSRLQGRIIDRMSRLGMADRILFVPPAEWRKAFDGLGRGTGAGAVVPVAARLGYHPPDMTERWLKTGDRATGRKVQTDYCSAYLIGRWATYTYATTGVFDTKSTSRYTTAGDR